MDRIHRVLHALLTARIVLGIRQAVYQVTDSHAIGVSACETVGEAEMFPAAGDNVHIGIPGSTETTTTVTGALTSFIELENTSPVENRGIFDT